MLCWPGLTTRHYGGLHPGSYRLSVHAGAECGQDDVTVPGNNLLILSLVPGIVGIVGTYSRYNWYIVSESVVIVESVDI